MEQKAYVTRLMRAKCSMGNQENTLNLTKDHGIWQTDAQHPVMNANDHIPKKHIPHFGRCRSMKNIDNYINIDHVVGSLIPGSSIIRTLTNSNGCKCKPNTIKPWINCSEGNIIEGAPALNVGSTLACVYGGIITVLEVEESEGDKE